MSYILDALKKADSERVRGSVPGLHAQPSALAQPGLQPSQSGMPRVRMALGALAALAALGLASLAAWQWLLAPGDVVVAPAAPPVAAATSPAATATAPAATPSPAAAPLPDMTPLPAATPAPALAPPAPAAVSVAPATAVSPPSLPLATPGANQPRASMAPAQVTPAPAAAPASTASATPAATSVERNPPAVPAAPAVAAGRPLEAARLESSRNPATSETLPRLSALPQDARLAMPKLTVSGASYSDNPAWRMVIINGQVFREGDKPAADMQLVQIRPKAAVVEYKGQRYLLGY